MLTQPLQGKACLITGATTPGSVGYATAQTFLRAGAEVVTVVGRDEGRRAAAVESLRREAPHGTTVVGVAGDLKKPETMAEVVKAAVDGMGRLDVVVFSGGNSGTEYLGLDPLDPESYHLHQNVSVISPLLLTEAAMSHLQQGGEGALVMVSSMAAEVPWPNTCPFNVAKAAQNALVKNLAFKYRTSGVRFNAVLPGVIEGNALKHMADIKRTSYEEYRDVRARAQPMMRCGQPEEVANGILFLASSASSFTTGQLLRVDGGLSLSSWWNQAALTEGYVGDAALRGSKEQSSG